MLAVILVRAVVLGLGGLLTTVPICVLMSARLTLTFMKRTISAYYHVLMDCLLIRRLESDHADPDAPKDSMLNQNPGGVFRLASQGTLEGT